MACIAADGDIDFYYDEREHNGGQEGTFHTFFDIVRQMIGEDGNTAAQERRANQQEYMSDFLSVPDMVKQAMAKVSALGVTGTLETTTTPTTTPITTTPNDSQRPSSPSDCPTTPTPQFTELNPNGVIYKRTKDYQLAVDRKTLDEDKPYMVVPCDTTIYLAFVPSNPYSTSASRLNGRLGLVRAIQKRSLTRQHPDTHYAHKLRKNVREYVADMVQACIDEGVDCNRIVTEFSIDDKAKVAVGEPNHPASSRAKANKKAIAKQGVELLAADHDTGVIANVVPAVQLRMDPTTDLSASRCQGKVVVYLRDGVFDGSNPWKHAVCW